MRASTARRNRALHILAHKGRRRFGVCGSDKKTADICLPFFDVNLLRGGGVVEDGRGKVVLQRNFDTAAHELLARHFHIVAGVDILYAVEGIGLQPGEEIRILRLGAVRLNTCTMPVESDASLYCHAIQSVSASEKAVSG